MSGKQFLYHAHGIALGGRITQPFLAEIDGQATTSLASIGGYSSSKAEAYTLNDIISYESAHCYVSGLEMPDGTYHTSSTCIVKGLNILHVVTADMIIGKLSSKHTQDGQPDISPMGSEFVNLKIAGKPVNVELDHDRFANYPTYDALVAHLKKQGKSNSAPKPRYQWGLSSRDIPTRLEEGMLVPSNVGWHQANGTLRTSMVKAVRPAGPDNSPEEIPYGHAIHIPHFGDLYLAEIYTTPDSKRLRMLRLELGSPFVGRVAVSEPVANGSLG